MTNINIKYKIFNIYININMNIYININIKNYYISKI
jgi:hypothetical protein